MRKKFNTVLALVSCSLALILLCGKTVLGQAPIEIDFGKLSLEEFGVKPVSPTKDAKTGFVVGGTNATSLILSLTEINGRSVSELEADMRPGADTKVGSDKGFLGQDERLLDVLAEDNRYVVENLGISHQTLARHLHVLGAIAFRHHGKEILYQGLRMKVQGTAYRGFQLSPFLDGTKTNMEAEVTNVKTGQKLKYSLLVPHMIERYGFYEGKGTPYRVDPDQVVEVLAFLRQTEIAKEQAVWRKHVVHEGLHTNTAVAGDFTKDGKPDIISNSGGKTRLFVAPDWREVILAEGAGHDFIHSEFFDVDQDGDLDWIGARYQPGLIVWLEQPEKPLAEKWNLRVLDDQLQGIHGLLKADIDGDGKPDLIANSAQPLPPFANSAAWLRVPREPKTADRWERFIFAKGDAPGLSHYFGAGDINGNGRIDIALAAKGGPQAAPGSGEWFAWWEAPADRTRPWTKRLIAERQPGATNIHPADVNGDGKVDFIATRGHGRGVVWFEAPHWRERVIHETLLEPHSLVVADLDGDGDLDAATCAYGDRLVMWFENDGRGKFTNHLVARDQAAYDIRAVDLDGDGDLDLLIAGQQSKNVVWYENPRK